jgi:hypothetical protein
LFPVVVGPGRAKERDPEGVRLDAHDRDFLAVAFNDAACERQWWQIAF